MSLTPTARGRAVIGEREGGRVIVWLEGEHDIATVAELGESIDRAIALDAVGLVADLSGVQFMDAMTIGIIVRARDALEQQSRSIVLRSPSRRARRVIDLCGLSDIVASADPGAPGVSSSLTTHGGR